MLAITEIRRMRIISMLVALVATASIAQAGDLGPHRGSIKDGPVAAAWSWTGFYVGGHLGSMWTESETTTTAPCAGTCVNPDGDGGVIGAQIGFNYQFHQHLVVGVEADWSWAKASGEEACANPAFFCRAGVEDQASVRGRLGFARERALFFATAGWAWAEVEGHTRTGATVFPDSTNRNGFIWGGGVDVAVGHRIIVGVEFLHADFGTKVHQYDVAYPVPMETDTLRFRLNYKF
jgi:outer membrane immunogenic protein